METNVVPLSFFANAGSKLARLDAEYAARSLLEPEQRLAIDFQGASLRAITAAYGGPAVNDASAGYNESVRYISIDSIDLRDGMPYPAVILLETDLAVHSMRFKPATYWFQRLDLTGVPWRSLAI